MNEKKSKSMIGYRMNPPTTQHILRHYMDANMSEFLIEFTILFSPRRGL